MSFDLGWYHWFQIVVCVAVAVAAFGTWHARLPWDTLPWVIGFSVMGELFNDVAPGMTPFCLTGLAIVTVLMGHWWLESIANERVMIARCERAAAEMRALNRHH